MQPDNITRNHGLSYSIMWGRIILAMTYTLSREHISDKNITACSKAPTKMLDI